jgi:dolichol kinase
LLLLYAVYIELSWARKSVSTERECLALRSRAGRFRRPYTGVVEVGADNGIVLCSLALPMVFLVSLGVAAEGKSKEAMGALLAMTTGQSLAVLVGLAASPRGTPGALQSSLRDVQCAIGVIVVIALATGMHSVLVCILGVFVFLGACTFLLGASAESLTPGELCLVASLVSLPVVGAGLVTWHVIVGSPAGWSVTALGTIAASTSPEGRAALVISCGALLSARIVLAPSAYRLSTNAYAHVKYKLVLCIGAFLYPWLWFVLGEEPLGWVWGYMQGSGHGDTARGAGVLYWMAVLASFFALIAFGVFETGRKHYHALVVVLFVPAMVAWEPAFIAFSMACVTSLFLLAELLRIGQVKGVGEAIDAFMLRFLDERDAGLFRLTHVYLLMGCAIPVWLHAALGVPPNPPSWSMGKQVSVEVYLCCSGTVVLGVGDALASMVGSRYGTRRLPGADAGSRKTLEGFLAATGGMLVATAAFAVLAQWHVATVVAILPPIVMACYLEATTTQIDNLVLPLYFWLFLLAWRIDGTESL